MDGVVVRETPPGIPRREQLEDEEFSEPFDIAPRAEQRPALAAEHERADSVNGQEPAPNP